MDVLTIPGLVSLDFASCRATIWGNVGDGASFSIDALYFSPFFGGGDASWAPAARTELEHPRS